MEVFVETLINSHDFMHKNFKVKQNNPTEVPHCRRKSQISKAIKIYCFCDNPFNEEEYKKRRDHCHVTVKYL